MSVEHFLKANLQTLIINLTKYLFRGMQTLDEIKRGMRIRKLNCDGDITEEYPATVEEALMSIGGAYFPRG